MNHLDPYFIDNEDLISKISLLSLLQDKNKYSLDSSYESKYYGRIAKSLDFIDGEDKKRAAIAIFANVFYITSIQLKDSLKYLYNELCEMFPDVEENFHLFELDPSGLRADFFRTNKISGRLDTDKNSRIVSIDDFIEKLHCNIFKQEKKRTPKDLDSINVLLSKKYWLLLTDFVLSGTSLCSELKKMAKLIEICYQNSDDFPKIIVCAQILTLDAKIAYEKIKKELGYPNDIIMINALYFSEETKVNHNECKLFYSEKTRENVVELCKWFHEKYIKNDPDQLETLKVSKQQDMTYGFKNCGYTIIPQSNAPSNSLPILWYTPSEKFKKDNDGLDYIPPFPRTMSRTSQKSGNTKSKLKELIDNNQVITNILIAKNDKENKN